MRLITNVTPLLSPLTGIGHYTNQLLLQLLEHPEVSDIRGFSPVSWYKQEEIKQLLLSQADSQNSHLSPRHSKTSRLISIAKKVPYARKLRNFIQSKTTSKQPRDLEDYLYWEPNYSLSPINAPAATTVYDLSHLHYPQFHPAERIEILSKTLPISIANAKRVVTISEYSKSDIIQNFSVPEDKIDIVPPAVSNHFRMKIPHNKTALIRQRYKLPKNYTLSVATLEPRKNIEGLIQAFTRLPKSIKQHYPLVLVGSKGWLSEPLKKLIAPLQAKSEIIRLGYVPQADMPAIFSAASCMAYVSLFEGYGMPVAEAMVSGTAVITSNCSSMPEVAKDSAILVNPRDNDDILEALTKVIEDTELRTSMELRGQQASLDYTWERSAEKLLLSLGKL